MEWLAGGAGVIAGLIIGYLIALARAGTRGDAVARLRADLAGAQARSEVLQAHNDELKERMAGDADVLTALAPLHVKVQEMARHVAQMDHERAGQYAGLAEQLRQARQGEEQLRATTEQLAGALRSGTSRGVWGEVELRRLLEAAGMLRHVDFAEQRTLGTGGRPDVVVQLPGGAWIPIDAKVPLDAYLEATAIPDGAPAGELDRRRALLAAHVKALRGHIDALAGRGYHTAVPGPDFTVLFLPAESLAAAAFDADPGLLDYALSRGVALAAPATLLALLKTVATMWQQAEVTQDAQRLLDLGRTLYTRLATLAAHVGRLGSSLESAVSSYNKMTASLESRVLVTARAFDSFDTGSLTVSQLTPESTAIRTLTSPELAREQ